MPINSPISRRSFLTKTAIFSGLGFSYHTWLGAQSDSSSDRVILLSDTHISPDPNRVMREVNLAKNLETVVAEIKASVGSRKAKALCITGDVAVNSGLIEDYEEVKRLLDPLQSEDLPLHLLMGNHDHREHCSKVIGQYQPQGVDLKPQIASKISLQHVNLYLLDSLIKTNYTPGEIGAAQFAWLEKELTADSTKPSVVLVHHNLRFDENKNALTDSETLFEIARKRANLKAFFFGHTHFWEVKQKEGKHLVNLPPVAYVFKEGAPSGWVDAEFTANSAELTLTTLNKDHELNGSKYELKWA